MSLGAKLKALWAGLRAWQLSNRRAHHRAPAGACCAAPDAAYAGRKRRGEARADVIKGLTIIAKD